jgi:hypothetical protein
MALGGLLALGSLLLSLVLNIFGLVVDGRKVYAIIGLAITVLVILLIFVPPLLGIYW